MHKFFYYLILLPAVCLITACSNSAPENTTSAEEIANKADISSITSIILIIETTGGCMMAGPNCPRYVLSSDGSFKVFRSDNKEAANSGVIDSKLVKEWKDFASNTNFDKLRSRLAKGECRACFDGVDFVYTVLPESKKQTLSSQEYKFAASETFFEKTHTLHMAMRKTAPLKMKSRVKPNQ